MDAASVLPEPLPPPGSSVCLGQKHDTNLYIQGKYCENPDYLLKK